MTEPGKTGYHVPKEPTQPTEDRMRQATGLELSKWAHDANCFETNEAAQELAERIAKRKMSEATMSNDNAAKYLEAERIAKRKMSEADRQAAIAADQQRPFERPERIRNNPFDPRTEVSADAKYTASRIIKHLWLIFVLLPFVAALLMLMVGVIK
jgi:hypothetical protein